MNFQANVLCRKISGLSLDLLFMGVATLKTRNALRCKTIHFCQLILRLYFLCVLSATIGSLLVVNGTVTSQVNFKSQSTTTLLQYGKSQTMIFEKATQIHLFDGLIWVQLSK
jgi:hypothetical protein